MTVEREVKLSAWAGLAMPPLDTIAEGVSVVALPAQRLSATYYDTADLRLARWGVTARHRSTEVSPMAEVSATEEAELPWTVKLPGGDGPRDGLARQEVSFAGRDTRPPAELLQLVRGLTRGSSLVPVARLRTDRLRWRLRRDGQVACEIDDDEVSVMVAGPSGRGRRLAARFREIEVELAPAGDETLLRTVVDALRAAGAGAPDPIPKVMRALGPRASEPPDVSPVAIARDATAAAVVTAALAGSAERLLRHDPGVRLGDDAEDVHQARVATRRLRSDLRTFGKLLDPAWSDPLREELGWIAALLGDVRDTDVLLQRLARHAAGLEKDDAKGAAALLDRLSGHREEARAALLAAMDTPRYTELLNRLVDAGHEPVFAPTAADPDMIGPPRPVETRPATEVLAPLVRKPWRLLRREVEGLGDEPEDAQLHNVRIRAKRCRYAAEAVAPAIGRAATVFADKVADLQGLLGDFHDAVVAEEWLRAAAAGASSGQALVAGQLVTIERIEAQRGRETWVKVWNQAGRKRLRAWL